MLYDLLRSVIISIVRGLSFEVVKTAVKLLDASRWKDDILSDIVIYCWNLTYYSVLYMAILLYYSMFIFKWDKRWEHSFAPGLDRELHDGSYERCWKTIFCVLFLLTIYQYFVSRRYLELSIWNRQLHKFSTAILRFPKSNEYG